MRVRLFNTNSSQFLLVKIVLFPQASKELTLLAMKSAESLECCSLGHCLSDVTHKQCHVTHI